MLAFPKPQRIELPKYLKFIRQHQCCVDKCWRSSQASHIVFDGQGRKASKVPDTQTVPKCAKHHLEYHVIGKEEFENKYGLNFAQIVISLLTEYITLGGIS